MPSALKPKHTFLGSPPNSAWYFLSIFLHCEPSAGCLKFPSFLRSSLCHHNNLACSLFLNIRFNRGIIGAYHINLAGTFFLGGLVIAFNIARVILSDLVPTCSAYRTFIQSLVLLTTVHDTV